ncbi:MAG: hypothetical protein QOK17_866 [Sphingomonadales bacterium]|jgi:hypothetical protein|nr:hypothetical protein [Sphingomonadales bacterium]
MSDARWRRTTLGVAAGAVICALLCSPAGAKSRDGEARAIMNRFAACTVQRRPEFARRFVLTPGVRPSPSDLQKVAPSECLWRAGEDVSQLRMRDALYRGALAEQLIRAEMAGAAIIDPASLPALEWPAPESPSAVDERGRRLTAAAQKERELGYAVALADDYVMRLGECVVRADPGGSRAAVLTEMDSAEELARLKAMAPTIAGCVARGQTLKFNRTTLRAALAVSYYRLAAAVRASNARASR